MKNNLWLLFSFLSYHIFAQTGIITGTVFVDNESVPGAEVYYKGKQLKGTTTDNKGNFKLQGIPYGKQTIHFSFVGTTPQTKVIEMSNTTKPINIYLQADNSLDEVVISGTLKPVSRIDSPVPVEVYTPAFFKKNPTPSIFDALQNVTGVRPQNNCGICNTGDIRINGLDGPYTLVLIDGMPIVSGLSTVYGLSGIPNALIERMEIVKGPASSLYGSEAVAGLVNIITKKPSSAPSLSVDAFTTSWSEFNFDIGGKFTLGKASSLIGINYFKYDQIIDNNNDGFTDLALQDRISIFNKWSFGRKSGKAFSIAGRFIYEDRWGGENNFTPDFRGGDEIYGESIYTSRAEIFGLYELPTKEDIDFTFSASTHNQNSFYGTDFYKAEQDIAFGQFTWHKQFGKHDFLLGTTGRFNSYDDNTTATGSEFSNDVDEIFIPSVFAQNQWKFAPKHELLTGLRYDYDDRHGSILTPRIAYKFKPTDKDVLRFNFGTGFRVVNLFTEDHAALSGGRDVVITENLAPEETINFNLNYLAKRYLNSGTFFTLEASAWYTYFSNRINPDYDTDPRKIIYANSEGHAISQGIGLQSDIDFNFGLKATLGATYQDVSNVENNQKRRQPLAESVNANWGLSYKINSADVLIDFTGNLYGPMRLPTAGAIDPRPDESPWWSIMNIQLTYKGLKNVEIYGGVKNLLDWTPVRGAGTDFVIARSNDPFEKDPSIELPFDPTYVYTSMQGIRSFFGVRYRLF